MIQNNRVARLQRIAHRCRVGGFDANNDDYEILSVTTNTITLVATGTWAQEGTTIDPVSLRDFLPLPGQMIRIGGSFVAEELFNDLLTFADEGTYLTLWRETARGWRVVLDAGVPDPD